MNNRATFKFVFGAMGCGKTAKLTGDYYSKVSELKDVIIVKPKIDTKGDNYIVTRGGTKLEATFVLDKDDNVYDLVSNYLYENTLDFVLVDEIEFLTEEQIIQLSKIVDRLGITVIGYAIITDFLGKMFPGAISVMEWADDFEYLPIECSCGNLKNRNMRIVNGAPVFEGDQIAIDGVDSEYKSVCRSCYEKAKVKSRKMQAVLSQKKKVE